MKVNVASRASATKAVPATQTAPPVKCALTKSASPAAVPMLTVASIRFAQIRSALAFLVSPTCLELVVLTWTNALPILVTHQQFAKIYLAAIDAHVRKAKSAMGGLVARTLVSVHVAMWTVLPMLLVEVTRRASLDVSTCVPSALVDLMRCAV